MYFKIQWHRKDPHLKREALGAQEGGMGPQQDRNPAEQTLNPVTPCVTSGAVGGVM
jgi:hypothetical protein